mmetsp:Transcript_14463/g.23980  ORF Transcript_14463/g.23980 Transcript_14463/m.23980 type:complete len:210 (-) Transcript_14463:824-1453(-)
MDNVFIQLNRVCLHLQRFLLQLSIFSLQSSHSKLQLIRLVRLPLEQLHVSHHTRLLVGCIVLAPQTHHCTTMLRIWTRHQHLRTVLSVQCRISPGVQHTATMNARHRHSWTLAHVPVHVHSLDPFTTLDTGHQLMRTIQAVHCNPFPQHSLIAASSRVRALKLHISTLICTMSLKSLKRPSPLAAAAVAITSGGVGALHLHFVHNTGHS